MAMNNQISQKFTLGKTLSTPAALEAIEESNQTVLEFLQRHLLGDWGDLDDEDKAMNDQALIDGSRILSAYTTKSGVRIWIITEAEDEDGNRAATTILLPSEY